MSDEKYNSSEKNEDSVEKYSFGIQSFVESVRIGIREAFTTAISTFEIPKFEIETYFPNGIPSFNLPDFTIPNVEDLEKLIEKNVKYGWTLTDETPTFQYLQVQDLEDNLEVVDRYCMNMYNVNNRELYKHEKDYILDSINSNDKLLVEQCFSNYEQGNYQIAIPTLLLLIEGNISKYIDINEVGNSLIRKWKNIAKNSEKDNLELLMELSLIKFMNKSTFKYRDFSKKREPIINRNWVLHGRDNPKLWKESDAMKLFINLSSVLSVKKYYH